MSEIVIRAYQEVARQKGITDYRLEIDDSGVVSIAQKWENGQIVYFWDGELPTEQELENALQTLESKTVTMEKLKERQNQRYLKSVKTKESLWGRRPQGYAEYNKL